MTLLLRQARVAGLGDGALEDIFDAGILALTGEPAEGFVKPARVAFGEVVNGADAEDGAGGAVAAEPAAAPVAVAAGEVDFAGDAAADDGAAIGLDDLADELVAGDAAEAVVAALELEVGVADATQQEANARVAFGAAWERDFAKRDAAVFEMDGDHRRLALRRRLQYHH